MLLSPFPKRDDRTYLRSHVNGWRQDLNLGPLTSKAVPPDGALLPIGIWVKVKG